MYFLPKRSTFSSRSEVNVERTFNFKHSKRSWTGVPIISSNMDTISSIEMFKSLSKYKCITCFLIYININEIITACKSGYSSEYFMLSTGITDKDYTKLIEDYEQLQSNGIDLAFICIDVANGYMFKLVEFCKKIRKQFPNTTIVAGNVVSRELVEELVINGQVDIIKAELDQEPYVQHDFKQE